MIKIKELLRDIKKDIIDIRREFHKIPELGFEENITSNKIKKYLQNWGYNVRSDIGGTGLSATLEGRKPGKTIAFRFDIDGLPIDEKTGLEFSSEHNGVMHACGHDGHIAIGLGTAKMIMKMRKKIKGNIKLIFQPAEELLAGAKAMVKDAILENPRPDAIFGLHIWPELESHYFGLKKGPLMAAADKFSIEIVGNGGHGAIPHKTKDSIVAAADIIESLQKIVSREVNPIDSGVISIGKIKGGTAYNIIPESVKMEGTVRTIQPDLRKFIPRRMEKRIAGVISVIHGDFEFEFSNINPAVINDELITEKTANIISKHFGDVYLLDVEPVMVSEDFAVYQQEIPGTYLLLGTKNKKKGINYSVHHPKYNIDEDVLLTGVELFCRLALEFEI